MIHADLTKRVPIGLQRIVHLGRAMSKNKSRRDFIKQAGAGAAALTMLPETATAQSKTSYVRSLGRVIIARNGEDFSHNAIEIIPDREYRKEFKAKTGDEKLNIECKPNVRGSHPHMENFLDAMRSRQEPNLGAELGYRVMAAIRMGVDAYRQQTTIHWDARRERAATKAM